MLSSKYLLRLLDDPDTVADLRSYYGVDRRAGTHPGRWFDSLAPNVSDRITAADLIAVQCLGMVIPVRPALELLEGGLGEELGRLLSTVPDDVDLGTGDAAEVVTEGSPADRAWHLLVDHDGVSRVVADKILARKRPRLIPVWDQVVRCALGRPQVGGVWESLDRVIRTSGGAVTERLVGLHEKAVLGPEVSPLRVLDVAVWMRHRPSHRPHDCPGGLGL
jgi:hypothetical protein